ncbi:MAG: putative 2OG-Fe(II) oxygenase [Terricaulis sp.]
MVADARQIAQEASTLKAAGRFEQAVALYRQVVLLSPKSAAAEHNLAAALGDAGHWREAELHIRSAFTKGIDAPESWLVLARCLLTMARPQEAEGAFRQALARRSNFYDAHRELAQLRWMMSGDIGAAIANLDRAIEAAPRDPQLLVIKAHALEHAGDLEGAWALLAALAAACPQDAAVLNAAAQTATAVGADAEALDLAERASLQSPGEPVVAITLVTAQLAAGQTDVASRLVAQVRQWAPHNQHAIALQATAWRLLGDARYRKLYNYDAFVAAAQIDTPRGWPDSASYQAELTQCLSAAHGFHTHPFGQSIRHGTQVSDVLQREEPALRALSEALDGPIRRYIAALGPGDDPLRSRNNGLYAYQGMWSIRMSAGGFHIDHVHPKGWLSAACYVQTPERREGEEGCIRFGQPGVRTTPHLDAEHFVDPEPGKLVLFPSYMWHGTVPYADPSPRMTIAFDLAPG